MPKRAATIESLPMAFEVVKQMQADGLEWGEGYRPLGRRALAEIVEGQMAEAVDGWLDSLDASAVRDRRNGSYSRHLLSELGDIALSVPRTRRFCPTEVLRRYARRAPETDRAIPADFVLGLSTRKTGAGALKRPVPVALGLRHDGRKEIVDFRLAASESAAEWERFLTGLYRRGLTGEGIETICADGGQGLIAALPTVCPGIPLQRCYSTRTRSGGPQDRKRPRQGPKARLGRRQGRPPRQRQSRQPTEGAQRRPPLRRRLGADLPQSRRLPAQRSRRAADLHPLQNPCRAQAGQNHQRHRTALPGSPATDTTHGHLPEQNFHGPNPLRHLHTREQTAGKRYPLPPDT